MKDKSKSAAKADREHNVDRRQERTESIRSGAIDAVLFSCLVTQCVSQQLEWVNVGMMAILVGIWAPHAYFRLITRRESNSVFQNKKKIESLTTSINLLSVKLQEVEKLSQQVATTQGLSTLNRKYTL